MIDELRAQNVALIRDATIHPAEGLTVLTGETGAGKSALLSSVKLLMGERAAVGAVREGADALEVEGRFFCKGEDPDGVVVRRRVSKEGRGRITLDGHMASVRELAEGIGSTIDLCGQHEHQRLLQPTSHVQLLDAWASEQIDPILGNYRHALKEATDDAKELERIRAICRSAEERLDEASFVLARIEEVNPQEGELEELEATLPRAEHAEALMRSAADARHALNGDDGALDLISDALDELRDVERYDEGLQKLSKILQSTLLDIEDVADELRSYRDSVDFDPDELAEMQSRMAQLRGLMRSYGPSMEDVFERKVQAEELVGAASNGDQLLREATRTLERAEEHLAQWARKLNDARQKAAPAFAALVSEQMTFLEMGSASLEVSFEELPRKQWTSQGPSKIELLYRPAAGLSARPLRRIASGGEISRVMLACKVVLGDADATETLVFDEVDAGVGGATAVALASVLARLATTHQVIVVTHLAQVAVRGARHYVVRKQGEQAEDAVPQTTIELVEGPSREAEIARMLSGDTSELSLAHARDMLAGV